MREAKEEGRCVVRLAKQQISAAAKEKTTDMKDWQDIANNG
jgi:hypothetical protein